MLEVKKMRSRDIKNGDTFAMQIENYDEEFNGRYLIFTSIKTKDWGTLSETPTFHVKITNDNIIPKIKEEINKLEYVKVDMTVIESAHQSELIINKTLYPDEFGYLYTYQIQIFIDGRKKLPEYFKYIGNYIFEQPKEELFPFSEFCIVERSWEQLQDYILMNYKRYNQKDPIVYNAEYAKIVHDDGQWLNDMSDEVDRQIAEGTLKLIPIKRGTKNNSLTYVGGDKNHPDYVDLSEYHDLDKN